MTVWPGQKTAQRGWRPIQRSLSRRGRYPTAVGGLLAALLLLTGSGSVRAGAVPTFSGQRAYDRIVEQCAFGPRVPGTAAHRNCLEYICHHLESVGAVLERQNFRVATSFGPDSVDATNVLARFAPEASTRLLIGAHWDTRPWSDEDPDSTRRDQPSLGANDGASGTAILLTLAEIFAHSPPPIGVDLAFFDVEDLGRAGHPEEFALGSAWMATHWVGPRPDYVLVLDMVGSDSVPLGRELYAATYFPEWNELPFQIAETRGYLDWDRERSYAVADDHLPFLYLGIPSNNIIGFEDPHWHTHADRPENISRERLRRVGDVVLEIIYGGYLAAP